jgi:DNA modification methylase
VGVRGKEENNMAKIEITKTELVWPGKYNEDGTRKEVERVNLPFQVIETINETRATREAAKRPKQSSLFDMWQAKEGDTFEQGWKNKLIWGDNLLVMSSLIEKFAGEIDLIYIDPPFATGATFSFSTEIGDGGLEVPKEQSIIEEKAYRDTWGKGIDSYVNMINDRLKIMRDLLSKNGNIFVHVDWRVGSQVRLLLNEILGADNFRNQISWCYSRMASKGQRFFNRTHDIIFWYSSSNTYYADFDQSEVRMEYAPSSKAREGYKKTSVGSGRPASEICELNPIGKFPDDWWADIPFVRSLNDDTGYPTQKPENLLRRILLSSSPINGLVADFFCGSGTTCAVAEKLGRRWIGCDLSRYAVHVSRKRLLGIENCKPFEVLNLGKYERKYWQGVTFGGKKKSDQQLAIYQYLAFILKLYGAEPISGMQHLHGKKGKAVVHVGAVDAPVTIDEINACLDECVAIQQKELHMLGWEWEMGLYDLMTDAAKGRGVKLVLLNIPREVMEQQAVDKGDIKFFELAYLEVDIKQEKGRKITISLKDFVIPNTELVPEEIRSKIKKWSDYIDYWAIDWDFQNDTFMNGWVTYRTRKDRTLALKSDAHSYEKPGKYTVMVKVVDIFGNDTSQAFEVEVK